MVSIYIIKNEDKFTDVPFNDGDIIETIKALKVRKPNLAKKWINVLEELEKKDFEEIVILENGN